MQPYYYIYNYGNLAPKKRHDTLESAQAEAERLARLFPKRSYEILKCIGISRQQPTTTFWMDGITPPNNT